MNRERLLRQVEKKFGPVQITSGHNGEEWIVTCPECGKQKLSINPAKGVFQCWHGCDSGSLSRLMGKHISVTDMKPAKKQLIVPRPPGELVPLSSLPDEHQAVLYVKNRGFDPKELGHKFGFTYCTRGRKFAKETYDTTNTIVVPVIMNNKLVGWQSRLLYNPDEIPEWKQPAMGWKQKEDGAFKKPSKYMTMPGMDRERVMFNYDNARNSEVVVVTEGVFDVAAVGACAIATFGKNVTQLQADSIATYWNYVVLMLDPDAPTFQDQLAAMLGSATKVIPVTIKGYKDAGEAPREEIWKQIINAFDLNGIDFFKLHVQL